MGPKSATKYALHRTDTSRKLKVYPKYQPSSGHSDRLVPELRLSGQWLEGSGFKIGEQVEIIIFNTTDGYSQAVAPSKWLPLGLFLLTAICVSVIKALISYLSV